MEVVLYNGIKDCPYHLLFRILIQRECQPLKENINQRRIISHCTWRPRLLASQPDLLPDFGQLGPDGLQKYRFEEIAAWGYPDGVYEQGSPFRIPRASGH
jgi:hypothetical protein